MNWELTQYYETGHGTVQWDCFGEGPPVVLLHGTPFSSLVWREIAVALSDRHRVYVWDMPGYGQSQMLDGQNVSLPAQQSVFTALLRHWGLDRPDVVAHDVGGAVALRSAVLDEVGYRSLTLVDVVATRPWGSEFFRLAGDNAEVFTALPPHLHEALVRSYVTTACHRPPRANVLDALVRPWLGATGQAAFYRQIAQADQRYTDEVDNRYGEVDCPVLVVWGADDQWLPAEHGTRLAGRFPDARTRFIDGAGHLVQEDAPAQLTAAISGFVRD